MKVSVILPTYNESGNIVALVRKILELLPASYEPEILVVDDNSPDGTHKLVEETFRGDPRVRPILRTSNRGLANSIRTGIEQSTGEQIVIMDTDFTHDPREVPRLLHVGQIYDIVIGSRFCAGGSMQDNTHYYASLAYNWMLRIILRTQVQDNLGGFFTIPRKVMNTLPLDAIFFGYGDYFFRLIFFVQRQGYTVVEIPAQYLARTAGVSKSHFLELLFTYSMAAIRLRLKHWGDRAS